MSLSDAPSLKHKYAQEVRRALVNFSGFGVSVGNMLIKRAGTKTITIKSRFSDDFLEDGLFLVSVLDRGTLVHDAEVLCDGFLPVEAMANRVLAECNKPH